MNKETRVIYGFKTANAINPALFFNEEQRDRDAPRGSEKFQFSLEVPVVPEPLPYEPGIYVSSEDDMYGGREFVELLADGTWANSAGIAGLRPDYVRSIGPLTRLSRATQTYSKEEIEYRVNWVLDNYPAGSAKHELIRYFSKVASDS